MPTASDVKVPHYMMDKHIALKKDIFTAKKNRLIALLVQKLAITYGTSQRHKTIITREVTKYVDTKDMHLSRNDIQEMETVVRDEVRKSDKEIAEKRAKTVLPTTADKKGVDTTGPVQISKQHNEEKSSMALNILELLPGQEWALVQAFHAAKALEKEKRDQELKQQQKLNLRKTLEKQILEAREMKKKEEEEKKAQMQIVAEDVKAYKELEDKKVKELLKKHEDSRIINQIQVEETQRRRALEKEIAKMEAKAELDRIEEVKRRDSEARQKQKEEDIRRRAEFFRANEEQKRLHELHRKEEHVKDEIAMQEYNLKMEREAAAREMNLKLRKEALDKIAEKFMNEGAGKKHKEDTLKEEQLLLKEQTKKAQADLEREQKIAIDKKRRLQEMKELNEQVKQVHDKEKQLLKQQEREEKIRVTREIEKHRQQEQEQMQRALTKQLQYRDSLKEQIQLSSSARLPKSAFDKVDLAMNKTLLMMAASDPEVLSNLHLNNYKRSQSAGPSRSTAVAAVGTSNGLPGVISNTETARTKSARGGRLEPSKAGGKLW